MLCYFLERLHLEQQGAVKMKCWRRNKGQKKSPEPKHTPNKKLTSNVLLESLSMLDLPTSSTSDSMPSSSSSPVLSDVNMRVAQEITSVDNLKHPIKTSRGIKNRKMSVQTMQNTDNSNEVNIECPTMIDQNSIETSQMFTMPVSNNNSAVTTCNNSTITASNSSSHSISSNTCSQPIVSNISQSIVNSINSQSFTNDILSQSIANSKLKVVSTQTVTNSGQIINITQAVSSNNPTPINSNKMIVNSISSNVCIVY